MDSGYGRFFQAQFTLQRVAGLTMRGKGFAMVLLGLARGLLEPLTTGGLFIDNNN